MPGPKPYKRKMGGSNQTFKGRRKKDTFGAGAAELIYRVSNLFKPTHWSQPNASAES